MTFRRGKCRWQVFFGWLYCTRSSVSLLQQQATSLEHAYDITYRLAADGTVLLLHLREPCAAVEARTHVSTRVEKRRLGLVEADDTQVVFGFVGRLLVLWWLLYRRHHCSWRRVVVLWLLLLLLLLYHGGVQRACASTAGRVLRRAVHGRSGGHVRLSGELFLILSKQHLSALHIDECTSRCTSTTTTGCLVVRVRRWRCVGHERLCGRRCRCWRGRVGRVQVLVKRWRRRHHVDGGRR